MIKKCVFFFTLISFFIFTINFEILSFKNKIVGYYPNWFIYDKPNRLKFEPKDINGNLLTHINYAFAKPYTSKDGKVLSYKMSMTDPWADVDIGKPWDAPEQDYYGNFRQLSELKAKYPHLKTLISIGGWSIFNEGFPSEKFSKLAADPTLRKEFIDSVIEFCIKYNFDGADIDWEYPGTNGGAPTDTQSFTILLKELSNALKDTKKLHEVSSKFGKASKDSLLLTITAPVGQNYIEKIQVSQIHPYVDWINLMTYDYNGAWSADDGITNHNAPLFKTREGNPNLNIQSSIKIYKDAGVPSKKLVMGMPLYGRSFAGVQSETDGLFAKYTRPGKGTDDSEPGMLLYANIPELIGTYTRHWDETSKVPYLYNPKVRQFISYDDEQSLKAKSKFIRDNDLGGAMWWSLAKEKSVWDLIGKITEDLEA